MKSLLSGLIVAAILLTSCGVPEVTTENAKEDENDSPQSTVGNGGDLIASYLHEVRFEASLALGAINDEDLDSIFDRRLIQFIKSYKLLIQDDLEKTRHDWSERKDDVNGSCGHVRSEDQAVVFFSPNPCRASFQSLSDEEKRKYAMIFLIHESVHHFGGQLRSIGVEATDEEHFAEEVGRHVYKLGAKKVQTSQPAEIPDPQPSEVSAQPAPIPAQSATGSVLPLPVNPTPVPTDCSKSTTVSANCDNLDAIKMDYKYVGLMYNPVDSRVLWSASNDTESVGRKLLELCQQGSGSPGQCVGNLAVSGDCVSVATNPNDGSGWAIANGSTAENAMSIAKRSCLDKNPSCTVLFTYCAL